MYKYLLLFFHIYTLAGSPYNLVAQNQTPEVTDKNIKYLAYLPQDYDSKGEHPLLIFLHGLGEKGDNLELVKRNGPPKLIDQGNWPSSRPFIVVSPQLPGNYGYWPPSMVNDIIEYAKNKYKVDLSRIYVTGLSLGGNGTWEYVTNYPHKVAAAVPVCGWGNPSRACEMKDVPAWAFHGDADGTVGISGSINMVNGINACSPSPKVAAKLTTYPGVGHDSWSRTYDLSAGHDIYSWMLSYSLENASKNNPPTIYAGADKILTLPQNSITLSSGASDADGYIAFYDWSKISGPEAKLSGTTENQLHVTDMVAGTYIFKIIVKDNEGATASDEVKVTVNPASNKAPTVDAGADKGLTLPANSISISGSASDADGSIATYIWTKSKGPSAELKDTDKAQLNVSGMVQGEYTFKLTVLDNDGASASDEVKVTVNPASNKAPTVYAGEDKELTLPANSISISGSASDSDGSIATYSWTKSNGPAADLVDTDKAQLNVSGMVQGEYTFKLTVLDNDGASAYDEVKIIVNPAPNESPSVNAGDDLLINLPNNSVMLSANAADVDGYIISYQWTKTGGPDADFSGEETQKLIISNMLAGSYTFKVVVTDDDGATTSDEVNIRVNTPPLANAGYDKTLTLPETSVLLSGAGSDVDGTIVSYEWIKIGGGDVTMRDERTHLMSLSGLQEGKYEFELIVRDNNGASASDRVEINVIPAENKIPIAFAGEDKYLTLPENSTTLQGEGTDADGKITSFKWSQVSGQDLNLTNQNGAELSLFGLSAGVYEFELTVMDDKGATGSDRVIVNVQAREIIDPLVIEIYKNDVSCYGESDGSAEALISGGVAPYVYKWSTDVSGPKIENLESGNYSLIVTDAAGNIENAQISIISPAKIEVTASISQEGGVKGLGAIKVEISGGTAPYTTKWKIDNSEAPHLKGNHITGLNASSYTLHVTDANGCTTKQTFSVSKKGTNAIAVYPNPSGGIFSIAIESSEGAYDLSIIDSKGKIIHQKTVANSQNNSIDITEFNLSREGRGIYFVKVQYTSGAFFTGRVIVK